MDPGVLYRQVAKEESGSSPKVSLTAESPNLNVIKNLLESMGKVSWTYSERFGHHSRAGTADVPC